MSENEQGPSTLDRIMSERQAKADKLRGLGRNPYRNTLRPTDTAVAVRAPYAPTKPPPPAEGAPRPAKGSGPGITPIDGADVTLAGRVMARRGFRKTVFVPIRDGSGDLQLYLNVDHLDGKDFAEVVPELDVGDVVWAQGPMFWTNRGELSLLAKRFEIVTKAIRPLPEKWHGLTDVEQRYRQRYVDLAVSPDVKDIFVKRSKIVAGLRKRNHHLPPAARCHPVCNRGWQKGIPRG